MLFLKFNEMFWTEPKCHVPQKFPFIPTEQEIDALIAASCRKHAALLSLLKETSMRVGEARRLE
jgi:integrase